MIINLGEKKPIKFGLTGMEEIIQNVRVILSTIKGMVPLDRNFGIDPSLIDEPLHVAQARLTSEIISVLARYEPRVIVKEVSFQSDHITGKLIPVINIEPRGGGG